MDQRYHLGTGGLRLGLAWPIEFLKQGTPNCLIYPLARILDNQEVRDRLIKELALKHELLNGYKNLDSDDYHFRNIINRSFATYIMLYIDEAYVQRFPENTLADRLWKKNIAFLFERMRQGYFINIYNKHTPNKHVNFNYIYALSMQGTIHHSDVDRLVAIILIQTMPIKKEDYDEKIFLEIKKYLAKLKQKDLEELIIYYDIYSTVPDRFELLKLLPHYPDAFSLIQAFKNQRVQKTLQDNNYKFENIDLNNKDFQRIFGALKSKRDNNNPEQRDLDEQAKQNLISDFNEIQQIGKTLTHLDDEQLKTGVLNLRKKLPENLLPLLAHMRQIMLRTQYKLLNDLQLLALIYVARHDDESLILQIQTGEGKSLISVMRSAYLALTGKIVDVFSAKESLPERDYPDAVPIMNNMGITRHALIYANSPVDTYHDEIIDGIGAVNYSTAGQLYLFIAELTWKNKRNFKLDKTNRVAYLDEIDYILLDNDVQIVYAAGGNDGRQNPDVWVYEVVFSYYKYPTTSFFKDSGRILIQANIHLKELCELLRTEAIKTSRLDSPFYKKYLQADSGIAPKERDEYLVFLMCAAHKAHSMQQGRNYSICKQTRKFTDHNGFKYDAPISFAQVMIENQIIHGATYSNLVHQFLHVKLNLEARQKGEESNFWVDPVSQAALSSNVNYMMKHWYGKIEGVTATAGSKSEMAVYQEYNITRAIKFPRYRETKSKYNTPIYCGMKLLENSSGDSLEKLIEQAEAEQVLQIAQEINQSYLANRPVLITCDDDIVTERLSKKISTQLSQVYPDIWRDLQKEELFIKDTNDTGITENQVVPKAGRARAVTISARMGRGTDIQPDSELGLLVIGTNVTHPRTRKQQNGRQGRNGQPGECKEIINYVQVSYEVESFIKDPKLKQRFEEIYLQESEHLRIKLNKHKNPQSSKIIWREIDKDTKIQNCYLSTRSVQALQAQLTQVNKKNERQKEQIVSEYSGVIFDILRSHNETGKDSSAIKDAWIDCLFHITEDWHNRFQSCKSEQDAFNVFKNKTEERWKSFLQTYNLTPAKTDQVLNELLSKVETQDSQNFIFGEAPNLTTDWWINLLNSPNVSLDLKTAFTQTSSETMAEVLLNPQAILHEKFVNGLMNAEICTDEIRHLLISRLYLSQVDDFTNFNQTVLTLLEGYTDLNTLLITLNVLKNPFGNDVFQVVLGKVNEDNANQLLPLLASKNSDEASLLQLIDKANTVDLARDIAAHNYSSQRIQDKLKELWPDHFTSQITPNLTDQPIDVSRTETNELVIKLFVPPVITPELQNTKKLEKKKILNASNQNEEVPPTNRDEPIINQEIVAVVNQFVAHLEKIKLKKFKPLINQLQEFSEQYLEGTKTIEDYKYSCMQAVFSFKTDLSQAGKRSLTLLEHISEVLRAFFNVLDNIVSLFSSKTMAETYNPVARSLLGRNHFFTEPDRKTELSQAMEAFEIKLGRLDGFNNHGVGGPT